MPIYDIDLNDAQEVVPAKAGEYQLRIISAVEHKSTAGNESIKVRLEVVNPEVNPGNPPGALIDDLYTYLNIPQNNGDAKSFAKSLQTLKEFCTAFQIPFNKGVNTDLFPGALGWCVLFNEEYEGKPSAKIKSVQRSK